jgi:hypothetical protein
MTTAATHIPAFIQKLAKGVDKMIVHQNVSDKMVEAAAAAYDKIREAFCGPTTRPCKREYMRVALDAALADVTNNGSGAINTQNMSQILEETLSALRQAKRPDRQYKRVRRLHRC